MTNWPAHAWRALPWASTSRRGTREDRTLSEVTVSIPPRIADLEVPVIAERDLARARYEAADLERVADGRAEPAGRLPHPHGVGGLEPHRARRGDAGRVRTCHRRPEGERLGDVDGRSRHRDHEAHRRVEHDDHARRDPRRAPGAHGGRPGPVRAALRRPRPRRAELDRRLAVLPPRCALRPAAAREVPALLDDLIAFSNRDDVEPGTQAAIAHAQFESIHPFTDGNGRIGRALIGAILRRRGVTPHTVLPVASALAADTTHYFSLLTAYREGDAAPIVTDLALCVETAAREARGTARAFSRYEAAWREQSSLRAGSARDRILPVLLSLPVFTVEQLVDELGDVPERSVYRGVQALEEARVVEAVTERVRGRAYAAMDVLDEFEDLDTRIRERITRLRAA